MTDLQSIAMMMNMIDDNDGDSGDDLSMVAMNGGDHDVDKNYDDVKT